MIVSAASAIGVLDKQFSYFIEATNNPTHYEASTLPPGLHLNSSTGLISGIPTVEGTFNVTIRAVAATSTNVATLIIRVNHALTPPPVQAVYYGFNAPFFGGKEKVLSRQSDEKLIKNDILQLLLTSPGERLYRPQLGSDIRLFLFELITQDAIDKLKSSIISAIQKYDIRVRVDDVQIQTDTAQNMVSIKVFGSINIAGGNVLSEDNNLLVSLDLPMAKINQIT
jgi:phage baseplate assembly protein W